MRRAAIVRAAPAETRSTSRTLAGVVPPTSNPVKVALVIVAGAVVTKSSAVSVSSLPGLAVRERVAILPSGSPVLKKN